MEIFIKTDMSHRKLRVKQGLKYIPKYIISFLGISWKQYIFPSKSIKAIAKLINILIREVSLRNKFWKWNFFVTAQNMKSREMVRNCVLENATYVWIFITISNNTIFRVTWVSLNSFALFFITFFFFSFFCLFLLLISFYWVIIDLTLLRHYI